MVCASRPDLISEVRVFPAFVFIQKSPAAGALNGSSLNALYERGGIEMLTPQNVNFGTVARLLRSGMAQRARRKLHRPKATAKAGKETDQG